MYTNDLGGSLKSLIQTGWNALGAGTDVRGLDPWDVWKVGAWLGFWPLISEDAMDLHKVSKFLKPLEFFWYSLEVELVSRSRFSRSEDSDTLPYVLQYCR